MSSNSPRLRVSKPTTSGRTPVVASIASARASMSSCRAAPTVPCPRMPIRKTDSTAVSDVTEGQVVIGLAAYDHPGVASRAEDHGRARDAVVVVRHRVTVRAGRGSHQHVAGPRVVELHVGDEDVARLA